MKRKPKNDYDEEYDTAYIIGVGSYQRSIVKQQPKVKTTKIVGFVRPKQTPKKTK